MKSGGRFEGPVYYLEAMDGFVRVDYGAKPTSASWVVVERPNAEEIVIEPFSGQAYIGVVRLMSYFELEQSEQWNPRMSSSCPG